MHENRFTNKNNIFTGSIEMIRSSFSSLMNLFLISLLYIWFSLFIITSPNALADGDDTQAKDDLIKQAEPRKITVAVNQYVNHEALDAAYKGLQEALAEGEKNDLKEGFSIDLIYANAQGNISNSVQISKHQASTIPEFMVAIATPSAQTNVNAASDKTITGFLAVSDPVSAGIIDEQSEKNKSEEELGSLKIIGVADIPPVEELIEQAIKTFPDLKTVGAIYNSGEINSVRTIERVEAVLQKKGIKLKKTTIANSSDIRIALSKIIPDVDVIYLPLDNTVISAIDSVISLTKKYKKPVIANDPILVDKGVTMALGVNYYNSGKMLGELIIDLINNMQTGHDIQLGSRSKVIETGNYELRFNEEMSKLLDLEAPKQP